MKLHFDPKLDYQLAAIEAVCDLFRGQEVCRTEFTVMRPSTAQGALSFSTSDLGIGNRLSLLLPDQLLENLRAVQLRNGVAPSDDVESRDFTVEMETGTGKTYVYLRTIFELNKRFGFTKFVIVVPSVAIKEGTNKSLEMTEDHFKRLYAGVPFDYFLYDSSKLGQVRNFATSSNIQIMVVTVGAINKKDVNNLYKQSEKIHDEKPIDLIRATNPIVIVDEPQSVDGGLKGRGKEALDAMSPLCTLRYSATHVDKHHMVYRLDAVDAYEKRLVKQIEVASATIENAYNKPYVRHVKATNKRGTISAKVELDVQTASGVRRKQVTVCDGDDLEQSTGRAVYENCRISTINVAKGKEYIQLLVPGGDEILYEGQAWGDVDAAAVQREMIRRTIREHLDKEQRLRPQGIKVLSLFFIDEVARYRQYDDDKNPVKGLYARIFEEEYRLAASLPENKSLFRDVDLDRDAEEVHGGYFSIDKTKDGKRWTNTDDRTVADRAKAERAYSLIMREKERLLSFDTPLKFIFSHSALREGWDNPNVFQICALRDIRTEGERRQTIGRGLRLCVNQDGQRVHGFDVNTLTVVARESYEEFAENLQKEIEDDTKIRFGVVKPHQFAAIAVADEAGGTQPLGFDRSQELWESLRASGYIDAKGKIKDELRKALKDDRLTVPEGFEAQRDQVAQILQKLAGRLEVKNADERRQVRPREAVLQSEEFKALWDRVKHTTTYRVEFDNEALVTSCIEALREAPPIPKTRLQWRKADLAIDQSGVTPTETGVSATRTLDESDIELPDLLTELQDRTQLTRRTIYRVVTDSGRLNDFKRNPQHFIATAADAINRCKRLLVVDGIRYQRLGDEHYYAQERFQREELTGYLRNLLDSKKSVYESVVYDSNVEASFADQLEKNEAIKVYAKLPGWFEIPTPLGKYNPDWAVLVEEEGAERLYFVVETKATLFPDDLRPKELAKIACGKAHFEALSVGEEPAQYIEATTVDEMLDRS